MRLAVQLSQNCQQLHILLASYFAGIPTKTNQYCGLNWGLLKSTEVRWLLFAKTNMPVPNAKFSFFWGQLICTSFGCVLKVLHTAVGRLDAPRNVSEFGEFTLARCRCLVSYFAKWRTCMSVTQCKVCSGQ